MKIVLITAVIFLTALCGNKGEKYKRGDAYMKQLRTNMVRSQIEARGITDSRVLEAMRDIERHKFVPGHHLTSAYEDHPLPIGHGQTISQPYIVALMSQLCELSGKEKVLEIGTGSGYQAAVLSRLAKEVYSIEIIEALHKSAKNKLSGPKYDNLHLRLGDGYRGWPEAAPFDVIILTAAPPTVPGALIDQLKDGGILIAPEGEGTQELVKMEKHGTEITKQTIIYVRFVPMVRGDERN